MKNKLMTFKHTKDGMLTVENQNGDFILKNEMLGVLHDLIAGSKRMLENYSDENSTMKDECWFKASKAKYEGQLEVLNEIKEMLFY